MENIYHGILLEIAFTDPEFIEKYTFLNQKRVDDWQIVLIEVYKDRLAEIIDDIQENMRTDANYFVHFYNNSELIIVFKNKTFEANQDKSSWKEAISYGVSLGMPEKQLDFTPNRFEDESEYFD